MTQFKMSDHISPYTAGITLEEALSGARALRAENVAAEVEDTTDVDEAIMTAEEMAIAMAGYAPRRPSTAAPPVVARPGLVFDPNGKKQMPTTKHGPDRFTASDDTTPPSSNMLVGHTVAESFGAGTCNNYADDLGRDINHSGSSITTPNGRQSVNYPVGNATLSGYFDSNATFVANPILPRFQTDYESPYTCGSVRYFGATGYPHGPDLDVGELNPGRMTPTSAPTSYAEHASNNIDVNGGYGDPVDSIYPDPESATTASSYVNRSFSFTTQGHFAVTTPSNFGDYNGYQQMASEQYTDHNNYLAHPEQMFSNQYTDTPQPMAGPQQMAPIQYQGADNAKAKRKPRVEVDRGTTKAGNPKKIYKKTFGTLYNERGKLPFPIQHYREYMNGTREMNGQFAESTLAPIPCNACAERGLTCTVLSREGDHGKVFSRMRKPWHNQQVSNYIVCGNCWNRGGTPQTCSFWRRPEGKEIPTMPYSRRRR